MAHPRHIREQALAAYLAGENSVTVGERFGIAPITVISWVRQAGEEVRPATHNTIPDEWREDALDYTEGRMTITDLARKRGLSKQGMSKRIQKALRRDYPDAPVPTPAQAALSTCVSFTSAQKQLGIDRSTLAEALRNSRIPGAFRWEGHWIIPKAGVEEYDRRRRERFPERFEERR